MSNTSNKSTPLPRLITTTFLFILAVTALLLTTPCLRADRGEDHAEQNGLPGTWISIEFGGSNIAIPSFPGAIVHYKRVVAGQ